MSVVEINASTKEKPKVSYKFGDWFYRAVNDSLYVLTTSLEGCVLVNVMNGVVYSKPVGVAESFHITDKEFDEIADMKSHEFVYVDKVSIYF